MARVRELRIRSDWGFVKFAYLPLVAGGALATKLFWPILFVSFRFPCAICILISRWGNHVEEWLNCKPLLQITDTGLRYEDGCEPVDYAWEDIVGIVLHRRNRIPPWRTDGSTQITPRYWLAISVRGEPELTGANDGYINRSRYLQDYSSYTGPPIGDAVPKPTRIDFGADGYVDRSQYSHSEETRSDEAEEEVATICVWPRQIVGGLFSLVRFAKELQRQLILVSDRGEIPSLLPSKGKRP
jgi:hypothetical protein